MHFAQALEKADATNETRSGQYQLLTLPALAKLFAQRIECGWLEVPQSRDKPGGRRLKLWVAIARADRPSGEPPLLYLHGGRGWVPWTTSFPIFRRARPGQPCVPSAI